MLGVFPDVPFFIKAGNHLQSPDILHFLCFQKM